MGECLDKACADHVQELLEENYLLQTKLNVIKNMYPEEMKMVEDALETIKEMRF
ncbi:MAG: hypothetical protein QQN41_06475 [Nitrosopumilus sp.]